MFQRVLFNPLLYLVVGYGFHLFAPDVGQRFTPFFNDASTLFFFIAAVLADPSAFLGRLTNKQVAEPKGPPL